MFVLPSDAFHRSGFAALRTIKVAHFFKMDKKPEAVDTATVPETASEADA